MLLLYSSQKEAAGSYELLCILWVLNLDLKKKLVEVGEYTYYNKGQVTGPESFERMPRYLIHGCAEVFYPPRPMQLVPENRQSEEGLSHLVS
ncbi:hypothetical protein MKX03_026734 [Papaver bracteatum]|nr:hypothetical protein MKX03_026734 [Papaver bracteatum]